MNLVLVLEILPFLTFYLVFLEQHIGSLHHSLQLSFIVYWLKNHHFLLLKGLLLPNFVFYLFVLRKHLLCVVINCLQLLVLYTAVSSLHQEQTDYLNHYFAHLQFELFHCVMETCVSCVRDLPVGVSSWLQQYFHQMLLAFSNSSDEEGLISGFLVHLNNVSSTMVGPLEIRSLRMP